MNFIYIDLDTGAFPLYQGDIRWQNPEISEMLTGDEFPCPPRYARVVFDPVPDCDAENERTEWALPPVFDGTQWRVSYAVITLTDEEKAERAQIAAQIAAMQPTPGPAQITNGPPAEPTVAITYIN